MRQNLGIVSIVAALSCGEENTYVLSGSDSQEGLTEYCVPACERFYDCSPKKNSTEEKCVAACVDEASEPWINCMLNETCDEYLGHVCEDSK